MRDLDPAATRTWRALSMLLPRWYREQYGAELLALHAEQRGRAHGVRFWFGVVTDVMLTSVQVRRDTLSNAAHVPTARDSASFMARRSAFMALRGLRQSPGFTFAVVGMLALGIGANVAMFTVLDRVLFHAPPHIVRPDDVKRVLVYGTSIFSKTVDYRAALAYPDYRVLRDVEGFVNVAAFAPTTLTLGSDASSARIPVELVTASYFPLLGVAPALGRFYDESEDRIGAVPTAVISDGFWKRQFGRARTAIGEVIEVGDGRYTIVGVAPKAFTGINIAPVDVWLPLHTAGGIQTGDAWVNGASWYWLSAIARVAPGRSLSATEDLATASYRGARKIGATAKGGGPAPRVVLAPSIAALGPNPADDTIVAKILGGVAVMVLLIACANVANLLLARGVRRRRQFAVQCALGVTRRGLIGQVLGESAILALLAGVAAFVVASAVAPALFHLLIPQGELPNAGGIRAMAMTFALSLVTCVVAGLGPAVRSSRVDVAEVLRSGRASMRSSWTRRGLLGVQAALSAVLLIGAGLFVRSLTNAQHRDLGVNLSTATIEFEVAHDSAAQVRLETVVYAALERLRANPAVASAAIASLAPFNGFWGLTIDTPRPDSVPRGPLGAMFVAATTDYFSTMGIALMRGRVLTDDDDRSGAAPVAVVNDAMARTVWHTDDVVGRCVLVGSPKSKPPCTTVVGVVSSVVFGLTSTGPQMAYYLPPHHPGIGNVPAQVIVARLRDDSRASLVALRAAARAAAPGIRYVKIGFVGDPLAAQMRSWRLGATLLSVFGALALLVATGGLYSVLAFDVAQRRFELGIRSALGAQARRLVTSVVGSTLIVTTIGVLIGGAGALFAARRAANLLFHTSPSDPGVYARVAIVMLGVTVLAAAGPAIRAVRVDPKIAMREE